MKSESVAELKFVSIGCLVNMLENLYHFNMGEKIAEQVVV
jgi:hypothetical protein